MLIALDYDFTFTMDPPFWRAFLDLCEAAGHKVICVTGREEKPDFTREPELCIPFVLAAGEPKFRAAMRAGYAVDIWIDDAPGSIEPSKELSFEDLKIVTPNGNT